MRGYITTGQNLANLDTNTTKGMNGDEGGNGSPSTLIEIAGKGVVIAGLWTMQGAGVTAHSGVGKPISFERGTSGDYFGIAPANAGASPSVVTGFIKHFSSIPYESDWAFYGVIARRTGARFYLPVDVYGGYLLDSVTVTFNVQSTHAGVPQYLPQMRLIAVKPDGTVIPLRSPDTTTDVEGFQFFSPTPASGAAWFAASAEQTWTYTRNVSLPDDPDSYAYFVEIIEESGTNAWTFTSGYNPNVPTRWLRATTSFSLVTLFNGRN